MRVFIGYDKHEAEAARVAVKSLHSATGGEVQAELLDIDKLRAQGLIWRTFDQRGGQGYDLTGNETFSTDFKFTRFLTPILAQSDFALFVDCDVVFVRDPRDMLAELGVDALTSLPLYVVKHDHKPSGAFKMVNKVQVPRYRKNWASVMLFNPQHPANRRLSLRDVNERPGRDLHAFYWLNDNEIGALDPAWNWLVDEQPRPEHLGIAHMTLGGPWLPGWKGGSFDDEWREAAK